MNAKQKIHQAKLNQWISLFKEQSDSGLTIRQWCEKNNYSFHTYNYWKHILKEEYASAALPDIVPVFPSDPALPTPVPSNEISGMTQTISHNSRDLRDLCHVDTIRITQWTIMSQNVPSVHLHSAGRTGSTWTPYAVRGQVPFYTAWSRQRKRIIFGYMNIWNTCSMNSPDTPMIKTGSL